MVKPRVIEHDDVFVVRDDLFPVGLRHDLFHHCSTASPRSFMRAQPRVAPKLL